MTCAPQNVEARLVKSDMCSVVKAATDRFLISLLIPEALRAENFKTSKSYILCELSWDRFYLPASSLEWTI
jgi:hypothetical protein